MSIIRQIPWTEQPQDAVGVDWGNPLASGVYSAANFAAGPRDVVSGTAFSNVGSAVIAASQQGIASYANGAQRRTLGRRLSPQVVTDFTVGVVFVPTSASVQHVLLSTAGDANYSGVAVGVLNTGAVYAQYGNNVGTTSADRRTLIGPAGAVTANRPYVICGNFSSSTTGKILLNGISQSLSASGTAATYSEGANEALLHSYADGGAGFLNGASFVAAFALWNRRISDGEMLAWCANPWQLFAPRTQRIWAPVAAGGAYSITAQPGSYALSGQTSTITRSRLITASAGAYTYTGQSATVSRSKLITASAGSYALSGQSATLLRSKLITASAGAYTYTGQSATITYTPAGAYTLTAQAGSYAVTGRSATLTKSRVINASAGSYSISGKSASISYSGAAAPAGISSVYFDVLSGRVLVLRARSASASTSSAIWTELEVDFGSLPVYTATFTITDASITAASKVQVLPCGKTATGRVSDDWAWDGATFAALPASGSATCYAVFVPGPIVGRRKVQYSVGA